VAPKEQRRRALVGVLNDIFVKSVAIPLNIALTSSPPNLMNNSAFFKYPVDLKCCLKLS
jgi:hypothetical protein